MDTLEKINLAISSKADIKDAIEAKGGSIEGDFSTFADAITNLPSGGGEEIKALIQRTITSYEIPSGVTVIGDYAFSDCTSLESITIPNTVTSINYRAFLGCTSLKTITIPSSVTYIGEDSIRDCKALTSIILSDGLKEIGIFAFNGNVGLTTIEFPSTVTIIRGYSLRGTNITTVTCKATTPPAIWSDTFPSSGMTAIYVPSDSVDAYKAASNWSAYADIIQAITE